ncbi:type VI secretion system protein IglI family protein [Francisella philomiragia]|uniref:type VI secretion system protein IglI family protein n=1 Tax=Francisella philomiragia TaxID=28110 RepID=UPI00190366A3|nr:type VI secretion system protein IglI family protein [Francisella philomiragia]MBK2257383.1 phage tail protein [Francisella philomiragia]MBK2269980.1 phage tail protein [Francisella philomiragia]MBK2271978.1 phage tail protein [Francisella philomiragia]MBK2275699.1 phage tail protein [Francisella philomiragia]MBK2295502.1 phage tail protein [Francisella philomiragia]
MSQIISTLNNIDLVTQDKVNLISNMQIQAKYENAEYKSFIDQLIDNLNTTRSIDIYNLFLSLNSEICLNLDTVDNISKIISSYLSILNTNFTRISPSESKQKNQLAEKGINKFLVTMDANFAQMQNQDKLLPNNIDSIIEIVQEVIIFFEKNNLNYNSDFKIQLNKTLRKIKSSLILKDQKNDTYFDKESINQVEATITDQKTIQGSEKWKTLIEKIEVLKALVESERIFETSIVYNDIQNLLVKFDPKEYFPEIFFPLYKKIAPFIGNIHKNIDYYSSSIQWSIAQKMYNIDYKSFLDTLEKMPENNFLNSSSDITKNFFYETSSEVEKTPIEEHKIIADTDAIKEEIVIKQRTNNKKNQNAPVEKISNKIDEDYFEDLFDI